MVYVILTAAVVCTSSCVVTTRQRALQPQTQFVSLLLHRFFGWGHDSVVYCGLVVACSLSLLIAFMAGSLIPRLHSATLSTPYDLIPILCSAAEWNLQGAAWNEAVGTPLHSISSASCRNATTFYTVWLWDKGSEYLNTSIVAMNTALTTIIVSATLI